MGHYSSGSQWVVTTIIMIRILAITSLAFLVSADADADAYYALHAPALVPALLNSYPNWPGVSTPFSSSTCYGCRGKRSAEPGYGLVHHFVPQGHPGFVGSYQSVTRGKRSADPG